MYTKYIDENKQLSVNYSSEAIDGRTKITHNGRDYTLEGTYWKAYSLKRRIWVGLRAIAKIILSLGSGYRSEKVKGDLQAFWTSKKLVKIYRACSSLQPIVNRSLLNTGDPANLVNSNESIQARAQTPINSSLPKDERLEKESVESQTVNPEPSLVFEAKPVTFEEAQQALEKGVEISSEGLARMMALMPDIASKKENEQLKFISRGQFFSVFTIPEEPDLVFKIANCTTHYLSEDIPSSGGSEETEKRFKNTVRGKQVILKYGLNLLRLPPAKMFTIESHGYAYNIIAEKRLAFQREHFEQEDLYYKHADRLKPLAKQLARFVFETGDDDVRFNNYPLLESDGGEKDQPLYCGVIDMEWAGKEPLDGFIGGPHNSRGLIGMMPNEELVDMVIEEGKKLGIDFSQENTWGIKKDKAEEAKADQISEIKKYHQYQAFCKGRGIETGNEPFMSTEEIDQLGLDLEEVDSYKTYTLTGEEVKSCTLRQAVTDIVRYLNKRIESNAHFTHVKNKRTVQLPLSIRPFSDYADLGMPGKTDLTPKEELQLWLNRILMALFKKGYIFYFNRLGGMHGFSITC
ncbi:hypothetical protein [Candidatus Protochlamydia phocaeensis]|uniref:hypothetical protein n=1 Tax=Candidatus Protochlamydia phocaeensis TaxID=1414722 RepID=UPI000838CE68|nr:hypothetical protein [Candidatus Protochlamydia phocaeensis]